MHGHHDPRTKSSNRVLDRGLAEDMVLAVDRKHEDVDAAHRLDVLVRKRSVVTDVCDAESTGLEDEDRIHLTELTAVRVHVPATDTGDDRVANLELTRVAEDAHVIRPRPRPSPVLARVVVVVRVCHDDSVRFDARGEVVPQPDLARERVDQDALPSG